jgi:hypothetical protein
MKRSKHSSFFLFSAGIVVCNAVGAYYFHEENAVFLVSIIAALWYTRHLFMRGAAKFLGDASAFERLNALTLENSRELLRDINLIKAAPRRLYKTAQAFHSKTFPSAIIQRGAVARNLSQNKRAGRQSGGSATATRQASSGKSSQDSDGGDGEPPRPQPEFLSYKSLAQRRDCSVKTLQNQFSSGRLGLTPFFLPGIRGPRFSLEDVKSQEMSSQNGYPHQSVAGSGGAI